MIGVTFDAQMLKKKQKNPLFQQSIRQQWALAQQESNIALNWMKHLPNIVIKWKIQLVKKNKLKKQSTNQLYVLENV